MMLRQSTLTLAVVFATWAAVCAQNPSTPKSFGEIFQDWDRQMQRGLPQQPQGDTIRLKPGQQEYFQYGPDSSSYFYFKIDTSMGNTMRQFFRFGDSFGAPGTTPSSPFGNDPFSNDPFFADPFGGGGMGNFNDIFKQMEEMQRQLWGMPPATAQQPDEDDGLLPEERIRLKEAEQQPTLPNAGDNPHAVPAKPKAKPKIKTTRI